MPTAYPITSLVPVRKMPSDKTEMTTQVLFGQGVEILETLYNWVRIRILDDGYEGWAGRNQFEPQKESGDPSGTISLAWFLTVSDQDSGTELLLPPGSILHEPDEEKGSFRLNGRVFSWSGPLPHPEPGLAAANICTLAGRFLEAPYLWGGKSPLGVDCSGLVQLLFSIHGIPLPRDARDQANEGETIAFMQETQAGDLAFFGNEEEHLSHVGLITGPGSIIHASGKVRMDRLDQEGIFLSGSGTYSHRLRLLKRVFR